MARIRQLVVEETLPRHECRYLLGRVDEGWRKRNPEVWIEEHSMHQRDAALRAERNGIRIGCFEHGCFCGHHECLAACDRVLEVAHG